MSKDVSDPNVTINLEDNSVVIRINPDPADPQEISIRWELAPKDALRLANDMARFANRLLSRSRR